MKILIGFFKILLRLFAIIEMPLFFVALGLWLGTGAIIEFILTGKFYLTDTITKWQRSFENFITKTT